MAFLIDGHNLIPKVGYSLGDMDVENLLIEKLQDFCRIRRTTAEVYFDGGLPGHPSTRKLGSVKAFFVRKGRTADSAIEDRLQRLGNSARNWTVVSSDLRVKMAAREAHAKTISSEAFSNLIMKAIFEESNPSDMDNPVKPEEVSMWLKEFGQNQD